MKRTTAACVAAAVSLAAIPGLALGQAGGAATEQKAPSAEHRITTDPERLELGWLRPTEQRAGTVRITNTSGDVVNLLRVTSSCSCTVGDLSEDEKNLLPGASTDLEVGLKAGPNTGPMAQRVYIWYEGSRAPYELFVSADVSEAVKTDPAFVNLLGVSKSGKVKLTSLDGQPFRVVSVDGRTPELTDLEGEKLDPEARVTEAYVAFDYTGVADAELDRWFVIETDHPEARELPLRVLHQSLYQVSNNRPTWNLATERLVLGRMQPGDESVREVRLKAVGSPEDVTDLSVDHEAIDAEIVSREVESGELVLGVRFVATGAATGLIKARLSVTAEGQEQEADVIVRVEELQ